VAGYCERGNNERSDFTKPGNERLSASQKGLCSMELHPLRRRKIRVYLRVTQLRPAK